MVSRRSVLRSFIVGAPFVCLRRHSLFAASPSQYSTRTIDVVQGATVIDMLGLVTLDYNRLKSWQLGVADFPDAELQRLRASGVTILHPAVGFTDKDVYRSSLNDMVRWNRFLAARSKDFLRVQEVSDLASAKHSGKVGVVLGLQNSSHFRTVDDVNVFHSLGQRVSQLTYFDNALGGGSRTPRKGLTEYGAQIIERMNAVGMAIDVSHCSDQTTLDAMDMSRKPVLITHSNCRALSQGSGRCKPDVAIRRLARSGGVLGVTMVRQFVRPRGAAGIEQVLDHIEHIARVAGIEHAGLGTDVDLDGRDGSGPRKQDLDGVEYSRKVFDIAEGLLRRGYSAADTKRVLGANFQRALTSIWRS